MDTVKDQTALRLDELAQRAGVPTTTIRLYQHKGLLPGPRLVGRTGYYGDAHVARLRLIGRLQDDGFSLASIGRLLAMWEEGRDLGDLVGVEAHLDAVLGRREEVIVDPLELAGRFPASALTPELMQRALDRRLVEPTDDGRLRVLDHRFLETGAALAHLGIPAGVILDEWEHLTGLADDMAERFVALFERHVLPEDWRRDLDTDASARLATRLARLRALAGQVLVAALDASVARVARHRLAELEPAARDQR